MIDLQKIKNLRKKLHENPEVSNEEYKTREIFKDFILNKAKEIAGDIKIESKTFDVFHEVYCDPNLCKESIKTLDNAGFNTRNMGEAFRGSEDFGVYSNYAPSMFFYLGNGKDYTPLHNDNYEFSDDLLEVGIKLWTSIAKG